MTRNEYLNRLSGRMRRFPKEDYDIAMEYFIEYFEEAGPENEQQAIADLGTPEDAADAIIRDLAYRQLDTPPEKQGIRRRISTVWIIILAIFASPIALPLAIVGCAMLFALLATIFSILVSAAVVVLCSAGVSVVTVFAGIWILFQSPFDGLTTLGAGLAGIGLSIVLSYAAVWLCRKLVLLLIRLFKKLVKKGGTLHEEK